MLRAAFGLSMVLMSSVVGCAEEADPCLLRAAEDCDVREAECVEHVHAVVACMRGAEHPLPPIKYYTAEEYLDTLEAVEPPTPEQARVNGQYTAVYKLLDLLPFDWQPASGPPEVSAPYIFYDWGKQEIAAVVDGGEPDRELDGLLYTLVLADRDAEIGIDARLLAAGTFDRKRALVGLIAGEATFYQGMASLRILDYAEIARDYTYADAVDKARRMLADRGVTWGEATAWFQYFFGAEFMRKRFAEHGPGGIDEAYESHADTTAFVLAGAGVPSGPFVEVNAPLPDPPAGFRYLLQDSYGPVMYLIQQTRSMYSSSSVLLEAEIGGDWHGDRLILAGSIEGDEVAAVWQIGESSGAVRSVIIVGSDGATVDLFRAAFVSE
jgi:hypothetical protein